MAPVRDLKPVAVVRKELLAVGKLSSEDDAVEIVKSAKERKLERKRALKLAEEEKWSAKLKKQKGLEQKIKKKKKDWIKKMLQKKSTAPPEADESRGVLHGSKTDSELVEVSDDSEEEETVSQTREKQNGSRIGNGSRTNGHEVHSILMGSGQRKMNDSRVAAKKMLQWILDPIPVSHFMKEIFEKRPLHVTNRKSNYYRNLFSCKDFDTMLRKKEIRFGKNLDVVKCIDGVKENFTPDDERANPSKVWGYFKTGHSIRMLNPQTYSVPVWRVCSTLIEFFNSFVGCNMYLTPAGTQGFAAHYDDIEAFILQIEGKKHWKVYNPLSEERTLPRLSSEDFLPHEIGEPILEVTLEPGDLLYMPRGFIHQGKAADDAHSLHLTISCHQKHTWGDFLMKLLPAAVQIAMEEDIDFRRSLPIDYVHHVGGVNSDSDSAKRKEFFAKIESLVGKLIDHAPVDACVDQKVADVLEEALPPVLSEGEKACSVHRSGEPWMGVEEAGPAALDFNIGVRLVRFGAIRLVGENEEVRLHYSVENTRVYKEVGPRFNVLEEDEVELVEALIQNYPQYVFIKDLPDVGSSENDKLAFVTDLYELGLLLTDAPVLTS